MIANRLNRLCLVAAWLMAASTLTAQLAVTVSSPKLTGSKAVIRLKMQNHFAEKIESARAVCFLQDHQGRLLGMATRWVIGGAKSRPALASKQTRTFNFVVSDRRSSSSTNLTAKVLFNRVVMQGGRQMDPKRAVQIKSGK